MAEPKGTKAFCVRLPLWLARRIEKLAKQERRSAGAEIIYLIEQQLSAEKG